MTTSTRAQRVLDAICPEEGLIFRRFEHRRILVQAAREMLAGKGLLNLL
jgi:hypothetical protein